MKVELNIYEPHDPLGKSGIDLTLGATEFGRQFKKNALGAVSFPRPVFLHFALEGGYGPLAALAHTMKASNEEREGLKRVLCERMKFLDATLELGTRNAYPTLPEGWKFIESSEKVFWSFCVGMIGARFGAANVLAAKGRRLRRFLHKSIYCNSTLMLPGQLIGTIPGGLISKRGEAIPDFLATDDLGNWHVFEAKGTAGKSFWTDGRDGLEQAMNCAGVSYIGSRSWSRAMPAPKSYSCVVTSITRLYKKSLKMLPV